MFNKKKLSASVQAVVLSVPAALLLPMADAVAEGRNNELLEEVVVTARKRQESLSDVPISVSAFSGAQLEALGVENSGDIALAIPNLSWNTEFGRASPQVYMRGIGTNNFAPVNQGPVAIYQDGVIIGPNIVQGFAAFDLERVEVLKGPQGTLFGRNSTAGLVNFVSKAPVIESGQSGYVSVEVGDWGTTNIEGAVGFDISEKWAARISGVSNNSDGEYTNLNPEAEANAGGADDYSIRAQFLYDNGSNFNALFNLHRSEADPDVPPFKVAGVGGPASCATEVVFGQCATAFGFIDNPDFHVTSHQDDSENTDNTGGFAKLKYTFDNDLQLSSTTAYDKASIRRLDDVDESPANDEWDHYAVDFEWFSQEFLFSGESDAVNWHAGLYYYEEENEGILVFDFPTDDSVFGAGTGFGVGNFLATDTKTYALFGQAVWTLSDTVRLTTGLRFNKEDKDIDFLGFTNRTDPNRDTIYRSIDDIDLSDGITEPFADSSSENNVSGRISIDFTVNDNILLFGGFARGFKGGDVNGAATTASGAGIVDSETLDVIEFGMKGTFLDGAMRANAAVFFQDYQDQQVAVILPGTTAAGDPSFQNAASSKFPGIEADITWALSDDFTLLASVGYVDAEFDDYEFDGGDFSGNRVPLVSKIESWVMGQYNIPLKNEGTFTLQADASYQSDQFFTPQNGQFPEAAALFEDDLTLLNASFKYEAPNGNWSAKLFVKNLTDKQYLTSGFAIENFIAAAKPGPGRYTGVSFTVNFDAQ